MDIDQIDWGPDEVQTLIADADKALAENRYEEAVPLYSRAIEVLKTPKSEFDPDLANCLHKLSDAYCALDRFEDACPVLSTLLTIGEHVLGPSDPDVIIIAVRLATIYDLLGRQEEAGPMYAKAVQMAEGGLPSSDPLTRRTRDSYAQWLERQTRPRHSEEEITRLEREARARKEALRASASREFDKMDVDEASAPVRQAPVSFWYRMLLRINRWQQVLIPAICSTVLLVGAFFWMQSLVKEGGQKVMPVAAPTAVGKKVESLDGKASIEILSPKELLFTVGDLKTKVPYVVLTNTFMDMRKALEGYFIPREYWYQETEDGLRAEDGSCLYTQKSPEFRVLEHLKSLAAYAQKFRQTNSTYPSNVDHWNASETSRWINPISGHVDNVPLQSSSLDLGYPFMFGGAQNEEEIKQYLRSGHHWADQPEASPCAIRCLSLFGTDKVPEGFKSNEFYIQGYDRNGLLLPRGVGGGYFYIMLRDGVNIADKESEAEHKDAFLKSRLIPQRVILVRNATSDPYVLKYVGPSVVGCIAGFFVLLWTIFDLPSRLRKEKKGPRLLELLSVAFLLLFGAWHALRYFSR